MCARTMNTDYKNPPVMSRSIVPLPTVSPDSDLFEAYTTLLSQAREAFQVPALSSVGEVCDYVLSLGSVPLDFEKYHESLADEFVDDRYVVGAFTLRDPQILNSRAKAIEKEMFVNPNGETFDPLEFGAQNQEWTTFGYEVEGLKRIHIILERSADDIDAPGNFRVHGGGQWLRETLWAATGIVPRDVAAADDESVFFGQAFAFVGREQFTSQEI